MPAYLYNPSAYSTNQYFLLQKIIMKMITTLLRSAFCAASILLCPGLAGAQPTLTSTTNGLNGSLGKELIYNLFTPVQEGPSGAAQTWNFSSLSSTSGQNIYYQSCAAHSCDSFPGSTFYSIDATQYAVYMNTTGTATTVYGAGSLGPKTAYSDPEEIAHFPFTYGNAYTDSFKSITTYSASSKNYEQGGDSVSADAWGTITTPTGTYPNALRIRTVHNETDSTSATNISYTHRVSYTWYVTSRTDFVFSISSVVGTGTTPFTSNSASWIGNTTGISASPSAAAVTLSPNPVADRLSLSIYVSQPATAPITITDITGRVQYQQSAKLIAGANTISLQTASLPTGLYFVTVSANGRTVVKRFQKL